MIGNERRYDAGLDDLLKRITKNWFCENCRSNMVIDDKDK